MTDHDHALSGAYAVDALDDIERARFEAHLRQCSDCSEEVASLLETAATLHVDEIAPPASVRDAVLSGIQAIRPLPPLVEVAAPAPVHSRDELAARRARRTATRLPLLVAAAVVLLLAVGTAWLNPFGAEEKSPVAQPRLTLAEQVLAADDAVWIEKNFPGGAHATVVHSRSIGKAVITTEDMDPAPNGHAYELWLQTPAGVMEPAGLMPNLRDATVVLEGDASRAVGAAITVEPAGGSERPSAEPIAYFTLDS